VLCRRGPQYELFAVRRWWVDILYREARLGDGSIQLYNYAPRQAAGSEVDGKAGETSIKQSLCASHSSTSVHANEVKNTPRCLLSQTCLKALTIIP